jgi:starvation-inducible outer membrane lipoprotein
MSGEACGSGLLFFYAPGFLLPVEFAKGSEITILPTIYNIRIVFIRNIGMN